jgi:hypothetical protein
MECHGDDTPLIPNTLPLSLHKICSYSMVFNADDTSIITLFIVTGLRPSPARMCSRICISPVLSERETGRQGKKLGFQQFLGTRRASPGVVASRGRWEWRGRGRGVDEGEPVEPQRRGCAGRLARGRRVSGPGRRRPTPTITGDGDGGHADGAAVGESRTGILPCISNAGAPDLRCRWPGREEEAAVEAGDDEDEGWRSRSPRRAWRLPPATGRRGIDRRGISTRPPPLLLERARPRRRIAPARKGEARAERASGVGSPPAAVAALPPLLQELRPPRPLLCRRPTRTRWPDPAPAISRSSSTPARRRRGAEGELLLLAAVAASFLLVVVGGGDR